MVLKSPLERDRSAGIPRKPTADIPSSNVEDALAYLKANAGVQPGDLATVATTGEYDDLLNKPTLGTAAAADTGDFATAAQGTKADSAVQPGDLGTAAAEDVGAFATAAQGALADSATQPGDLPAFPTGDIVGTSDTQTLTNKTIDGASNTLKNIWGAVNLKEDSGAKGDGITKTDGAITSGDNTLTSASSSFTSADVGKAILVIGAGAAGVMLVTTIASINSGTSVELTDAASTTVSSSGVFTYGTDDTSALNTAFSGISSGRAVLPPGVYVATDKITIANKNELNSSAQRSLEVSGYGAKIITSVASDADAFLFDDIKNLSLRGLEIYSPNRAKIVFDGVWRSRFTDIRAETLKLDLGLENLDSFESHYWLKFTNCDFLNNIFHTGVSGTDPTESNAIQFDNCRIEPHPEMGETGAEYAIEIYGSQGVCGIQYINCDVSYYTTGMIYVDEAVSASSHIEFIGGFFDSGLIGTDVDTKGLTVNYYNGVHAPSSPAVDSARGATASRQTLDFFSGVRNGSRYPTSSINLFKNGDLARGSYGIEYSASGVTTSVADGPPGLFDQFLNFTASANRTVSFVSQPLPFDGYYSITVLVRNNGDAIRGNIVQNGTVINFGAIDIPSDGEWCVCSVSPATSFAAGDVIKLQFGPTGSDTDLDYDVAYAGLTYGRIGTLLASPSPSFRPKFEVLAHDAAGWSHTGDTTETALVNVLIPAGSIGKNGQLRITTLWSHTNNSNSKAMRVKHNTSSGTSGVQYTSFAATTTAITRAQTEINNRNSEAIQIGGISAGQGGWASSGNSIGSGTINTAVDSYINITAQLADGGDTMKLESYTVEVLYQA